MRLHTRRITTTISAACLAAGLVVGPAGAISDGTPDHDHHNVGAMLLTPDLDQPDRRFTVCSGSLLTPSHFLTSAHCVIWLPREGFTADNLSVTFEQNSLSPSTTHDVVAYEMFPGALSDRTRPDDVAVLTFAEPVEGITPIEVVPTGWFDDQAARNGLKGHSFTNVGYGVVPSDRGRPSFAFDGNRRTSTSPFKALNTYVVRTQEQSNATGEGGACYGDSGSPRFVGALGTPEGNLVAALVFGGTPICRSDAYNQRLDLPWIQDFLGQFTD